MHRLESTAATDRNQRLYEYLRNLGLYVAITLDPDDREKIDSITVSASEPKVELIPFDVCFPPKRTKVTEIVRPALRHGDNVVDLPPKL